MLPRFPPLLLSSLNDSLKPFHVNFKPVNIHSNEFSSPLPLESDSSLEYGVFASSFLPTGSIILRTIPLVISLFPSLLSHRCAFCHSSPFSPSSSSSSSSSLLRCSSCKIYHFCSLSCQKSSWNSPFDAHKLECKLLKMYDFKEKVMDKIGEKYSESTVGELLVFIKFFIKKQQENMNPQPIFYSKDPVLVDSSSLFQHFPSHFESCEALKKKLLADGKNNEKALLQLESNELFVDLLLSLNILPTLSTPSFPSFRDYLISLIYQFSFNNFALTSDLFSSRGMVVSSYGAMLNHSCKPNCFISYLRVKDEKTNENIITQIIKCLEDVQIGEELTHPYFDIIHENFYSNSIKRQNFLKDAYSFNFNKNITSFCFCQYCLEKLDFNEQLYVEKEEKNFDGKKNKKLNQLYELMNLNTSKYLQTCVNAGPHKELLFYLIILKEKSAFFSIFHSDIIELLNKIFSTLLLILESGQSVWEQINSKCKSNENKKKINKMIIILLSMEVGCMIGEIFSLIYSFFNEKTKLNYSMNMKTKMFELDSYYKNKWNKINKSLQAFLIDDCSCIIANFTSDLFIPFEIEEDFTFLDDSHQLIFLSPSSLEPLSSCSSAFKCSTHHPLLSIHLYTLYSICPYLYSECHNLLLTNQKTKFSKLKVKQFCNSLANKTLHLLEIIHGKQSETYQTLKELEHHLLTEMEK